MRILWFGGTAVR